MACFLSTIIEWNVALFGMWLTLIGVLIVSLPITQAGMVIPAGQSFLASVDAVMDSNRSRQGVNR